MRKFVVSGLRNEEAITLEMDVPKMSLPKEEQAAIVSRCYVELGIDVLSVGVVDCIVHEVRTH
jgi:hypothetical protein